MKMNHLYARKRAHGELLVFKWLRNAKETQTKHIDGYYLCDIPPTHQLMGWNTLVLSVLEVNFIAFCVGK